LFRHKGVRQDGWGSAKSMGGEGVSKRVGGSEKPNERNKEYNTGIGKKKGYPGRKGKELGGGTGDFRILRKGGGEKGGDVP